MLKTTKKNAFSRQVLCSANQAKPEDGLRKHRHGETNFDQRPAVPVLQTFILSWWQRGSSNNNSPVPTNMNRNRRFYFFFHLFSIPNVNSWSMIAVPICANTGTWHACEPPRTLTAHWTSSVRMVHKGWQWFWRVLLYHQPWRLICENVTNTYTDMIVSYIMHITECYAPLRIFHLMYGLHLCPDWGVYLNLFSYYL